MIYAKVIQELLFLTPPVYHPLATKHKIIKTALKILQNKLHVYYYYQHHRLSDSLQKNSGQVRHTFFISLTLCDHSLKYGTSNSATTRLTNIHVHYYRISRVTTDKRRINYVIADTSSNRKMCTHIDMQTHAGSHPNSDHCPFDLRVNECLRPDMDYTSTPTLVSTA